MPAGQEHSHVPLTAYLDPPAGLSSDWQNIYRALVDPVRIVTAFYCYHNASGQVLKVMKNWWKQLRQSQAAASAALRQLPGRAPRTLNAGYAIDAATAPVLSSLQSLIHFESRGSPSHVGPRVQLHEMRIKWLDPRPLLEELAAAVVAEANSALPSGNAPPSIVAADGPTGFLGGTELAEALGVHPSRLDAFLKRLERARIRLPDSSWREVRNPQANSPRFQYRGDAPRVRDLAKAYRTPKGA